MGVYYVVMGFYEGFFENAVVAEVFFLVPHGILDLLCLYINLFYARL